MRLKRPGLGVAVFAAAFVIRAAWVLLRWSKTGAALEFPDEELHWQLASNLINDGVLVSDDERFAARMPGYPLFLAMFAWTGDLSILLARLAQALLGAATAWLAFAFVDKIINRRAALLAGVLICLDPYTIFFTNLLLTEVLFIFFAVGLVVSAGLLLSQTIRKTSMLACAVALSGAAALLIRPSAAGWIILLWILLWLFDSPKKQATKRLAINVIVMAACLLPWGLRNNAVVGDFAWLSTNGGVTLYDAQGPQANGGSDQAFMTELPQLVGLGEVERDRELRRLAVEQMRENPRRVLSLAWTKLCRTWSLTPNVADYRSGKTALASALFTGVVLLLSFAGLVRSYLVRQSDARLRPRRLHVLLWLPVFYFTAVHCVFIGSLRYRIPLMPFLEIAAATALIASARESDTDE